MKLLIVYSGIRDELHGWPDNRSLALQRVAGSNVIGHILNQLRDARADQLALLVDRDEEAIAAWFAQWLPDVEAKIALSATGADTLQALAESDQLPEGGSLLLALGNHITEANFHNLDRDASDLILFTNPQSGTGAKWPSGKGQGEFRIPHSAFRTPLAAGVFYFRKGADLRSALEDTLRSQDRSLQGLLDNLAARGLRTSEREATLCLDASSFAGLLQANQRLLGLGYGSEDAIERSYVEDFTVIPPVYIHETAVIENSVIGPFVNIEAGARISNSVVRDSLIGEGSLVENIVLDRSLIGDQARVIAGGKALIVKSSDEIALDGELDGPNGQI